MTTSTVARIEDYLAERRERHGEAADELAALYHRDYHTCDCALPYVERKWNEWLGVFCEIRLCCLARAVERLTGATLFSTFDFTPLYTWDCDELVDDGHGNLGMRGRPADFLLQRAERRGIEVRNL